MPERYVSVRWPDGHVQQIYSPSTVVEDYFAAGERVPVDEFVARSRAALGAASERVRAAYGFPCGRAAAALADVTATAGRYAGGDVTVERIEP